MTALEEVRKLQQQGMNEEQIIRTMRDQGTSYKDIADSLAQTRIKAAVEQPDAEPGLYGESSVPNPSSAEGMQASLMGPSQEFQDGQAQELSPPSPNQPYAPQVQEYSPQYDTSYAQQQYPQQYQQGTSSDVVTEIAEQVVAEKLGEIRKHLEKVIDLKTTFEAKVESIDDRLKRIEKTIDLLQSSVLRKVGDYVTNIQDIKSELVETQKTFAKLSSQRSQHPHTQHHPEHHKSHSNAHHHPQHKK